ncbi:hypothetical protein C8R43DRAFT_1241172 [Mycena crocata]|nr:hypothetical protein C8R43DRAFT_1241172 [Mycena crocata]
MQTDSLLNYLRTGYVPFPPELEALQSDLTSLSKELGRLDTLIRDLSAQRDKIEESVELHRAVLAPVRRLPDDVVQHIFLACLPTDRNAVMSTREAPLLLCRTCSTWRVLALATPKLWASLHVPISFILGEKQRAQALIQWLERAAGCPLSLSICGSDPVNGALPHMDPSSSDYRILLNALIASRDRWHNVAFMDLDPSYHAALRAAPTPILQVLRIKDRRPVAEWLDVVARPGIHTLNLEVVTVEGDGPLLLPAFSSLTHLSISAYAPWGSTGIPGRFANGILRQLTQLVSLKIVAHELEATSGGTTRFPVLESLTLNAGSSAVGVLEGVLENLAMPRLHHLSIDAPLMPGSSTPLFATLRTSSPELRSLELGINRVARDVLRGMLPHMAPLTRLVIYGPATPAWHVEESPLADAEHFLALLSEPALASAFTDLQELGITFTREIEQDILFKFLQTRVDQGGQFSLFVNLYHDGNMAAHDVPDVERFRAMGLHIRIKRTGSPLVLPTADAWTGLPPEPSLLDD